VRKWIISHCAYGFVLSFLKGTSCLSCRLRGAVHIIQFADTSTEIVVSIVFLFVALCGIVLSKGYFGVSFLEYLRRYSISYTQYVKETISNFVIFFNLLFLYYNLYFNNAFTWLSFCCNMYFILHLSVFLLFGLMGCVFSLFIV
jgi:hypothetical protein